MPSHFYIIEVVNMKTKFLLLILFLASCYTADSQGLASLRVQNTGNIDFQSVRVGFTGAALNYGKIVAGFGEKGAMEIANIFLKN